MRCALPLFTAEAFGLLSSCAESSADDVGGLDGGASTPTFASSARLAIDDTSLYWCDSSRGFVMRAPRGGGEAVEFVEMPSRVRSRIAVNATSVFWFDRHLNDDDLFDVALMRTALDGSDTRFLAIGGRTGNVVADERSAFVVGCAYDAVTDGAWVYYKEVEEEGEVSAILFRAPLSALATASNVVGIAVDDEFVYWTEEPELGPYELRSAEVR